MGLTEKAAYLKGLLEGFKLDENNPENKLLKEIIGVLGDIAEEVSALGKENDTINDFLDELDYDLGALEEDFYGCDDDCCCDDCCCGDDDDDDDDFCDCCCDDGDEDNDEDDGEDK